jgi:rhodanese-related sulfurtransferase
MRRLVLSILPVLFVAGLQPVVRAGDPPAPPKAETPAATPLIDADQLLALKKTGSDPLLLDVRKPEEFAAGHVPGAINIPHDQLASRLGELPASRDKPVVVYCRSGRRSALAEDVLRQGGYQNVQHLKGDMLGWEAEGRPIEK